MFVTRLLSGIALVIISVIVLYFGGYVTGVFTLVLSLIGVYELCKVYKIEKKSPAVIAYLWTVFYYVVLMFRDTEIKGFSLGRINIALMVTFLLAILAVYVFRFPEYHDKEIMAAFMSFFYVSVMLSYLYKVREMPDGNYFVVLVFICSWGNDTLAYCVGRLFGKHKMSPKLSPKKSVEGLFGGLIGAGLLGIIYAYIVKNHIAMPGNIYLNMFIIGALGAIPAVIGDLAASAIKRNNDIKDYSKLIPGHGGVLDRFDSMIFTAPIIYYLVLFMYN